MEARQLPQPLWLTYQPVRHAPDPDRRHRPVQHRHGYEFGFPNCTAAGLDLEVDLDYDLDD